MEVEEIAKFTTYSVVEEEQLMLRMSSRGSDAAYINRVKRCSHVFVSTYLPL